MLDQLLKIEMQIGVATTKLEILRKDKQIITNNLIGRAFTTVNLEVFLESVYYTDTRHHVSHIPPQKFTIIKIDRGIVTLRGRGFGDQENYGHGCIAMSVKDLAKIIGDIE